MSMMDSSADNEKQLTTSKKDTNPAGHNGAPAISPETEDYRSLLVTTRPFRITEDRLLSSGIAVRGDEEMSLETGDWRAEFALRKGEILRADLPGERTRGDGGPATAGEGKGASPAPEGGHDAAAESVSDLPRMGSDLKIRIYLGMS
jgi:hypothetical protein